MIAVELTGLEGVEQVWCMVAKALFQILDEFRPEARELAICVA